MSLVTVGAFGAAALLMLAVGVRAAAGRAPCSALFVLIGLLQGSVRTSRDMMVRKVTPPGAPAGCSPS